MSFKDSLETDLDVFIDTEEFAVIATVDGLPVNGIYDRPYVDTEEVSGYQPSLTCKTIDVSTVAEDDTVIIDGVNFRISSIEPDGTGITKLKLEKI